MTYAELQEAVQVLGLGKRASLKEIKSRYRQRAKRHHPDTAATEELATIRRLNEAYRILQDYGVEYRFSFAEDEFYEQNPRERLWRQFEGFMWWDVPGVKKAGGEQPPAPSPGR